MKRTALVATLLVAAAAAWRIWPRPEFRLPPRIAIEDVATNLVAGFDHGAVAEEAPGDPVRLGGLQPSRDYNVHGAYRHAIVAPPPSIVRFRVQVPPGAFLRFGVGIDSEEKRDSEAGGVRFAVSVDGREVFARAVNPAATRHDRRWFDERVDLGAASEVEIVLRTDVTRAGARLAGVPGWSHVQVVREEWHERQAASRETPSVLLLLVDTLRADRLGCYGAVPSCTPTLDRLAARGLVFEQAVAQSSWTLPSVATILTGLYPRSHGILGGPRDWGAPADVAEDEEWAFLADGIHTLAEAAAATGITTAGVSANPLISPGTNLVQGFETFVELGRDGERHDWPPASEVNAPFLRWLAQNRGRRFFGYLHYMEPHDPYTPPDDLRPAPPPGLRPLIASGHLDGMLHRVNWPGGSPLPAAEIEHLRRLYDGAIRGWDRALAALLQELEALGVADSTVVLVTADHGEEFQEHGRIKHGSHLYEESIRVPLVLAGPSVAPARVAEQAESIDVFPTIAGLLGLPSSPGLPGQNLLARHPGRTAFSETRSGIGPDGAPLQLLAARTGSWKLIHTPALDRWELYDLARDPTERENRFGEVVDGAALVHALADWRAAAPPPPVVDGHDPALRAKLRALGYVE